MASATKLELDLYEVMPNPYTRFEVNIYKRCRERSEIINFNKCINSSKDVRSATKGELDNWQNRESTKVFLKCIVRKNNDKFEKRIGLNK